jgi:hypothetical protein
MPGSYVVSDLARQRREVVDAARAEPVRIRDTDGVMLVLTTEDRELAMSRVLDLYALHARAEVECRRRHPNAVALGEVAFIADWPVGRREEFLDGFAETLDEARRLGTVEPVDFYIRWHAPFEGPTPTIVDPALTARLGDALQRKLGR